METKIYITSSTEHITGTLSPKLDAVFTPERICEASQRVNDGNIFYITPLAAIIQHFGSVRFSINDPDAGTDDQFL